MDFKGTKKEHLLQVSNPTLIKKLAMMNQEGSPLRSRAIHFTNIPPAFEMVISIFKNLMTGLNRNKYEKGSMNVHVHATTSDTLRDFIPEKCLPFEYKGNAGPLQNIINNWEDKLDSYRDYLISEKDYGIEEKKRIKKLGWNDALSGTTGSFRKLEID